MKINYLLVSKSYTFISSTKLITMCSHDRFARNKNEGSHESIFTRLQSLSCIKHNYPQSNIKNKHCYNSTMNVNYSNLYFAFLIFTSTHLHRLVHIYAIFLLKNKESAWNIKLYYNAKKYENRTSLVLIV